jgi:osmotically-inducible protein OsmY
MYPGSFSTTDHEAFTGHYPNSSHDDDLALRVRLFLWGRHRPALRNLEVTARDGTVLLRGRVANFHHKQLAIEFTRRVAGVLRIIDELIVDTPVVPKSAASEALPLSANTLLALV